MSTPITATAVKALRERTNAPMMDCKAVLIETNGDIEKAVEKLREKNLVIMAVRLGRETVEGRIGVFIDPAQKVGAIVEVRCESAPVAKSEPFVQLANDVARQVALQGGATTVETLLAQPYVDNPKKTVNDRISEVIGLIRENMKVARMARLPGRLGSYCHHDGTIGVLLQVEGAEAGAQLLRDVCMHIAASNPVAIQRRDIGPDVISQARKDVGEANLDTWLAEHSLVDQPFVKDAKKTVGQLLQAAGLKVVRFVRYKVGEVQ